MRGTCIKITEGQTVILSILKHRSLSHKTTQTPDKLTLQGQYKGVAMFWTITEFAAEYIRGPKVSRMREITEAT
jgi:hypothetical protein